MNKTQKHALFNRLKAQCKIIATESKAMSLYPPFSYFRWWSKQKRVIAEHLLEAVFVIGN